MVMIAIRNSGTLRPNTSSANTSLGFGHGSVVEMRTFMYDTRKQEKMNVSLSRNIHIIALPHGTGKACLSADQSALTPFRPPFEYAGTAGSAADVDSFTDRSSGVRSTQRFLRKT